MNPRTEHPSFTVSFAVLLGVLALGVPALTGPASGDEVEPGTIVSGENWDRMKTRTFQGTRIQDLLTENFARLVKQDGLRIRLRLPPDFAPFPQWAKATRMYHERVGFDPETKEVSGYRSGVPFPEVSEQDPDAGWKIFWNWYYGGNRGDEFIMPSFNYSIYGVDGLEREIIWNWAWYRMKGRLGDLQNPVEGDGSIYIKQLLFAKYPYDLKGLGTFLIRYDTGRMDDQWAFIRTVRRTRRMAGGGWHDPVPGGVEQLNDEIFGAQPFPTWYPDYQLVDKRTLLLPVYTSHRQQLYDPEHEDTARKLPAIDFRHPPKWNPDPDVIAFRPVSVYVIETPLPDEHRYQRRLLYIDSRYWLLLANEAFDRRNEFIKMIFQGWYPDEAEDGTRVFDWKYLWFINVKDRQASIALANVQTEYYNVPTVEAQDITLQKLREGQPIRYTPR